MTNPYTAPSDVAIQVSTNSFSESKKALVSWSWKLPLLGLAFTVVFNAVARPFGAFGAIVFGLCVLGGLLLSIVGIYYAFTYSRILKHAIAGLLLNCLFIASIFAMFHAISLARDAARMKRDQVLPELGGQAKQVDSGISQPSK